MFGHLSYFFFIRFILLSVYIAFFQSVRSLSVLLIFLAVEEMGIDKF
jgi:hypothetical protein